MKLSWHKKNETYYRIRYDNWEGRRLGNHEPAHVEASISELIRRQTDGQSGGRAGARMRTTFQHVHLGATGLFPSGRQLVWDISWCECALLAVVLHNEKTLLACNNVFVSERVGELWTAVRDGGGGIIQVIAQLTDEHVMSQQVSDYY